MLGAGSADRQAQVPRAMHARLQRPAVRNLVRSLSWTPIGPLRSAAGVHMCRMYASRKPERLVNGGSRAGIERARLGLGLGAHARATIAPLLGTWAGLVFDPKIKFFFFCPTPQTKQPKASQKVRTPTPCTAGTASTPLARLELRPPGWNCVYTPCATCTPLLPFCT